MKKDLTLDIAIARTARNFLLRNDISAEKLAEKIGISKSSFESKIDVTNFHDHLTPSQLDKLQDITGDITINKIIKANRESKTREEITELMREQMRVSETLH